MTRMNRSYFLGALSVFLAFGLTLKLLIHVLQGYSIHSWNLSEWLINYSGGLTRRGLPGAGILALSKYTNTSPYWWVLTICLVVLGVTVWILIRKSRKRFHSYILFSPILFGGPILGDYWLRKDIIGVLFLLMTLKIQYGSIKISTIVSIGLVNVLCSIMILSHEAYGFYALPLLILINAANTAAKLDITFSRSSLVSSFIDFFPSIVCFVMMMFLKGNEATAMCIHQSWSNFRFPYDSITNFPHSPTAAIDSIGWTMLRGLKLPFSLLTSFSHGIYVPLAWAVTLFISASFMISSLKSNNTIPMAADIARNRSLDEPAESSKSDLFLLLFFQLIFVSPLFVLGSDYGRWIFLWGLSSITIFLYTPQQILDVLRNVPIVAYVSRFKYICINARCSPYYLLVFAVPAACWSLEGYIHSTPVMRLLHSMW
jgi:hypothetical protein